MKNSIFTINNSKILIELKFYFQLKKNTENKYYKYIVIYILSI